MASPASEEFALPPAATAIVELQGDGQALLLNSSAEYITIIGNGHSLKISPLAAAEASIGVNINLSNVIVSFDGHPTIILNSLATDYASLSSASATFALQSSLTIGGDEPGASQSGNPTFGLASGAQFAIANAHWLPNVNMLGQFAMSLGNGQTAWIFSGLAVGMRFVYGQANVQISNTAGPTDTELSFSIPDSSLVVTKGWTQHRDLPIISTGGNPLNLTLEEPADFFYGAGAHIVVSPATLSKMSFEFLYQTEVTVNTTVGISELVVSDVLVNATKVAAIGRRQFVGVLRFVHDDLSKELRLVLSERICANLVLELRPNSILALDDAWMAVADQTLITLNGSHAKVYYEGDEPPKLFDVIGTDIQFLHRPDAGDAASISSGTVVGLVFAALAVIPTAIGLYIFCRRRYIAVKADEYDRFTDIPSDQGAILGDL
jgi:hypothetical protein